MNGKMWTLTISDQHLAVLLDAVQDRPFRQVYRIVESISQQMREQQRRDTDAVGNPPHETEE